MPHSLTNKLYSGDQARALDRRAIADFGIAGTVLMKRAGRAAFDYACRTWPGNRDWVVLCGGGNNGGDGYVFAALAAQKQHRVTVLYLCPPEKLTGEAAAAYSYAQQEAVPMMPFSQQSPWEGEGVVVDALLGIGLREPVRPDYAAAIDWINQTGAPVFALDLPSGLCANTGTVLGNAVVASHTLCFIAYKLGLFTGRGPVVAGHVELTDLQLPADLYKHEPPVARRINTVDVQPALPARQADAHKGDFGHVMVVGGDHGYGGAALLAAETASMTGAGLVSLATRAEHIVPALVRRPEVMALGVASGQELQPHLRRATVLVVGPGLGRTPWSEQLLQQALATDLPLVLDADALNILAEGRLRLPSHRRWVMTPHPGEAARLLGCTTAEVQHNRLHCVQALQQKYGGIVLLKGAGTLLCDGAETVVAKVGNPGLATAGSGDVLSGLIGSFVAQGLTLFAAAQLAVCLHGDAADLTVKETGIAGLQASELIPYLRELLKT